MSHLEYVQQESAKNMEFHMENMGHLQKESNTTLTFLFVVISASFSAAVKLFAGGGAIGLALSLAILCVYLTGLAVYLIFSCLMARTAKAPANEPENLKLREGYTSEEIQQFELDNLQSRIQFNQERNEKTAWRLNLVRVMVCASPLIFFVVIVFSWLLSAEWGTAWF